MDSSFFAYLERLELILFFSGFPLVYAVIVFIADTRLFKPVFRKGLVTLLPFSYALAGLLYLGLQLKKLYPDYSFGHIRAMVQQPYLLSWAMLSVFFFLPMLRRKIVFCLLHSLVFLFMVLIDLFQLLSNSHAEQSVVANDMRLYGFSVLLHSGCVLAVLIVSSLFPVSWRK